GNGNDGVEPAPAFCGAGSPDAAGAAAGGGCVACTTGTDTGGVVASDCAGCH
ncbi:monooxygenase, partial [Salmonella enterica subsp. enterica serovar Java]|nr:monooxygenase [Salmonella enterica subsp. enterica serovar Java]